MIQESGRLKKTYAAVEGTLIVRLTADHDPPAVGRSVVLEALRSFTVTVHCTALA